MKIKVKPMSADLIPRKFGADDERLKFEVEIEGKVFEGLVLMELIEKTIPGFKKGIVEALNESAVKDPLLHGFKSEEIEKIFYADFEEAYEAIKRERSEP